MTSYKFKLHSKARKDGYLDGKITRHLRLYNKVVELGDRYYRRYKKILRSRALTRYIQMKKHDPAWDYILKGLNAWAVQETIRRRDEGLDRYFKYLRKKRVNPNVTPRESPPEKHSTREEGSFKLAKGHGWKLIVGGVATGYLWNMLGRKKDIHTYRFFGNREIKGTPKNAVFKRDRCGDFWCIITTTHSEQKCLPKTGKVGGFDFSQEHFFVGDDGRCWDITIASEELQKKLAFVTRRMHKALEKGNNRERWKDWRARLYRKIANIRREAHYALAWRLCREYDVMCFENNDYQDMYDRKREIEGHRVPKKQRLRLNALAPASFLKILSEVARKTGKTVFLADRYFASSQTCSNCGHVNKAVKSLRIRKWRCIKCGEQHDRDINAAKNLVKEYHRTAGGASSVGAQTDKETEKLTYWERIRKSAAVKRAAGSGEKSPCPQNLQAPDTSKADGAEAECPELYTDAYTVVSAEGARREGRGPEVKQSTAERPPG